ncbi:MAG: ABC transporter ATP-binding protein [Clostridia bacterium]|nr:ABC transporter ATP-binding protein [Clostridia bacterium]
MSKEIALELKNITKSFGRVVANRNVNLTVYKNEILSLLGENGSGKTTLMNMISGIYFPDEGEIFVDGKPAVISSPKDAFGYGIGMIHQHFKLVDTFTAAQNIILGIKNEKYNIKLVNSRVREIAEKYGFDIDPKKKIHEMSVSEKQTVEIIKVLYRGANILILDEPTAVLTPQEIEKLFAILRKMRDDGKSIIIITHKLNEVMEISDRVSILRKGEYIGTVNTCETTEKQLTEMMVGKQIELKIDRVKVESTKPLLEIRDLVIRSDDGSKAIKNVSFYIRGGEILGVAGITGCGQKELCEAIAGLRKVESGFIMHKGESIVGMPPKLIIEKGISMSFIPEDRLGMGLAPSFSITDNMMLKTYGEGKTPFVNRQAAREKAQALIEKLEIATPSTETPVRRLSGGNVQKVLVGREIDANPNVIVTAYPVRGLDINSAYAIYDILNEQKSKGVGILFVGEDLDVMLALCDKILVLCHGEVMGIVHAAKVTKDQLGLMMTGAVNLTELQKEKNFGIAKDSNLTETEWLNAANEQNGGAENEN